MGKKRSRAPVEEVVEEYSDQIDSEEEAIVEEMRQKKAGNGVVKKKGFCNEDGLAQKLEDIATNLPFVETMQVESFSCDADANDDLKREVEFYKQALNGVKLGRAQLEDLGVDHIRPADYFAEMVKSDDHMARIKQRLLFEKQKMDAFEQRKKSQEYKKFSKQLQAEKIKEKSQKKKQAMEDAKNLKGIIDNNNKDEILASKATGSKRKRDGDNKPNAKRAAKDRKFGFGGRKKNSKRNTSDSASGGSFSMKQNRSLPTGMSNSKFKNKKGAARPGKARRDQQRKRR